MVVLTLAGRMKSVIPIKTNRRRSFPGWIQFILWLVVGAATVVPQEVRAQTTTSQEYQVKAAFLFNFAQFVEWPTNAFSNPQTPLVIGIIGDDPFGATLDEIVRGENVNGHPLVIQRFRQVEEIKTCHILFINSSEKNRAMEIIGQLKGRSVLTVGDTEGFATNGGMIRFVTEKNKIRFRVNLEAAKAANLTISSKLLKAAGIVVPEKN